MRHDTHRRPAPAARLAPLAWLIAALTLVLGAWSRDAVAAPAAHILRIDPRAAQDNGNPVLTTVIEVVQSKRVSEAIAPCAALQGNALFSCMSQALEKPYALYTPFPFPAQNAIFTVNVDGTDRPAKYLSDAKWGDSQQLPGVGTAWLILVDADARMRGSFDDAQAVAQKFVASLGPNDIVNVMYFNDRQVVADSKWLPAAQKAKASKFLSSVTGTYRSGGRNRSLLTIIKTAATDGFSALGNVGEDIRVPLHQAMVVLSSGYGGTDPSTTGPGAIQLAQYMTQGRFSEENTALPKAPVPVISVYFPPKTFDEFRQNSTEFMQNLANPEIGGFFTVMQDGEGDRAQAIVNAVRTRFSKMYIVKWKVACVAPTITQSFKLVFSNVQPNILGDSSFKDVPVGIDPTTWPLDVNVQYTQEMAKRQAVYPGGAFKVYGDFCWGGDKSRAEVYFIPSGTAVPTALAGADIEKAKRAQQQLIAMGMKGTTVEASDTYAQFQAPDKDKILHGSGDQAVVRLILYDNKAHRTSGVTADSIIQLKGSTAPLPMLWILGGAFAVVVMLLLVVVIVKSGGKKRGGSPPPAPVAAMPPGGGYPGPQGGYAPVYGAGGPASPFGATTPAGGQSPFVQAGVPAGSPPQGGPPQGVSPEFMYGAQPQQGGYGAAPGMPAAAPPPNPYAAAGGATRAVLQGATGIYTVVPGVEVRAGRDGAACAILLNEPRVSGVHATLKLENGQLYVRDEGSNNGTLVNGNPATTGVWTVVPNGSLLRFGPVEFSARLE